MKETDIIGWARYFIKEQKEHHESMIKCLEKFESCRETGVMSYVYAREMIEMGRPKAGVYSTIKLLESPAEALFYYAFMATYLKKSDGDYKVFLIPRYEMGEWGFYKADFAVRGSEVNDLPLKIVIEIDKDDERLPKEPKIDDKIRGIYENKGYTFLRFSGSEVFNGPEKCVEEVFKKIEFLRKLKGATQ